MKRKKILYALVGVGAGNATRTQAILDELALEKFEIRFLAQGRAYDLLHSRFHTYRLHEITYSRGEYSPASIVRQNYAFPIRVWQNIRRAAQILDEFAPDVVIADSDFFCLYPARRRRIPVISVNSSAATVHKFRAYRRTPSDCFFSYHVIERVDYLLQRAFATMVVTPVFSRIEGLGGKFKMVNPIVRRSFLQSPPRNPDTRFDYDAVVMFGGSGIGAKDLDFTRYGGRLLVLGQTGRLKLPSQAETVGFEPDPARYLARARIAVVQGGFNSISELLALRIPAVMVPIQGHAEQFTNAVWAERLGLGLVSTPEHVVHAMRRIEVNYEQFAARARALDIRCDGACQAARLIEEFLA
ncbi:MAG: hypothetical protein Kow0059_10810 [Candidatus Sumerlaeia bacterium]